MRNRASVLVGLLWCLALLSVLVIGVLHTARLDLQVAKNYGDVIQAAGSTVKQEVSLQQGIPIEKARDIVK